MAIEQNARPGGRKPLRLWPGVVAVVVQWVAMFGVPLVVPDTGGTGILAAIAGGLAVLLWWLFFSRMPWLERVGAIVVMVLAVLATSQAVHESISNGMMGFMLPIFAILVLSLALVVWAAATRGLPAGRRRASMVGVILLACGTLTLIRTDGISGDARSDLEWRWTPTAEERLLAGAPSEPADTTLTPTAPEEPTPAASPSPVSETPQPQVAAADEDDAGWPGFRGHNRDSIVRDVRIDPDWSQKPPVQLWRRPIGPGWSSFAVQGDVIYTQEQRGDDEMVSAYDLNTGDPAWRHTDAARFWESNGGPGPRATPTLHDGRVYTMGATGILNALDARTGSLIWSRTATSDTGAKVPDWGIASSPVIVGDQVVVATAGMLAAYDLATGDPRWIGPKGGWGYSSPHLVTIDGTPQVVLVNGAGVVSVAPSEGTPLWAHEWGNDGIVQPGVIAGGDFLIGSGSGLAANLGMRRVAVTRDGEGWGVKERWTTTALKPYFNDFVVHEGHVFGFDASILACVDLENGTRKWKGGRYGHGQMLLLADQDLLLVLSEDGELALVSATPDGFREVARFRALEGKTWNHPVLAGDILLVRNGEEMAAFRLSLASR